MMCTSVSWTEPKLAPWSARYWSGSSRAAVSRIRAFAQSLYAYMVPTSSRTARPSGSVGDVPGRLGRGAHRDDLEVGEVVPRRDPGIEERPVVRAHELEAAEVVEVHPAVDVLEAGRELAP